MVNTQPRKPGPSHRSSKQATLRPTFLPSVAGSAAASTLIRPEFLSTWVSVYLVLWTARLGSHLRAGYLKWPLRRHCPGRRVRWARRWLWWTVWMEILTSLVLAASLLHRTSELLRVVLLAIALAIVTSLPVLQDHLVCIAKLPTGGAWIKHRYHRLLAGSDTPVVELIRSVIARKPGMRISNLSRLTAWGLATVLAAFVTHPVLATALEGGGGGTAAPTMKPTVTVSVTVTPPPSPQPTVTITLIPAPPSDSHVQYDPYCKLSPGGPIPAADAPPWARTALYDLYLGTGVGPDAGLGAIAAGCAGPTHTASDPLRTVAWEIGTSPVTGEVLSVATYSAYSGKCIVLDSAALDVAALVERGLAVGCTGRHAFGRADGDAYLVGTGQGTYAYLRNSQWAADGSPESYVELPPGVSDAWSTAEAETHQVLIPVKVSATLYRLETGDGQVLDHITVRGTQVWLVSKQGAAEVRQRAQLTWSHTLS